MKISSMNITRDAAPRVIVASPAEEGSAPFPAPVWPREEGRRIPRPSQASQAAFPPRGASADEQRQPPRLTAEQPKPVIVTQIRRGGLQPERDRPITTGRQRHRRMLPPAVVPHDVRLIFDANITRVSGAAWCRSNA